MISLIVSTAILTGGYFLYGGYVDRKFGGHSSRITPV